MNLETFRDSLSGAVPPDELEIPLQALWWAGKGNWDRAHACVQQREGEPSSDGVHAYLHRVEGDMANAGYWYGRAGEPVPEAPVEQEWSAIAARLLSRLG